MGTVTKKPILSISLLASNRPDTLPRCLDSLKPILEAIPSELILVDTSNNEAIHKLLLTYTDKVYKFKWCNDFAKARNVGLKKAKGEWFLFLDDDEWFVEIDELIHFFQSGEYKKYVCANYIVRNFFDKKYMYYSDSWVTRMVRIDSNIEFKSKIHEYLYPVIGKDKSLQVIAYHSGYIFASKEEKEKHFQRNSSLLLDMIAEEPDNLRWQIQLAQEYRAMNKWEKLYSYCQTCLKSAEKINNRYDNVNIGTFYMGYLEACINLKKYKEGLEQGKICLNDFRSTDLSKAMTYSQMAELYFRCESYKEAELYAKKYFKKQESLTLHTEDVLFQQSALLVAEAYDDTRCKKVYTILIGCDLKKGSTKCLNQYFEKLEWTKPVIYIFEHTEKIFIEAMVKLPYEPIFSELVTYAFKNKELKKLFFKEAQNWEQKDKQAFQRILSVFAKAEGEDWYLEYARVLTACNEKNREAILEAVRGYLKTVLNIFIVPEDMKQALENNGFRIEEFYVEVEFVRWKEHIISFAEQVGKKLLEKIYTKMAVGNTKENIRTRYLELYLLQFKLMKKPIISKEIWEYKENLKEFAEKTLDFYGEYYKEEVFLEYPELLPKEVQAACKIIQYLEIESQDKVQGFAYLKECVDVFPIFANAIKGYLQNYTMAEYDREREKREEFRKLRNQILMQAKALLKQGKPEQTISICQQLKQMVPNDLEVIALNLEARLAILDR